MRIVQQKKSKVRLLPTLPVRKLSGIMTMILYERNKKVVPGVCYWVKVMSNIKNKQHYVFQAYLKNWCNEDDKLWVFNKKDGKIFSSGTNNILNKRRFYQLRNLNEDERKFLEFLMECLKVNKATKVEMRRHRLIENPSARLKM